ncbi:unnamed protein product [Blepharisma stoltei]|uniref:Receptor ligand binding region domain-containing protein n=1 Tax=Blepharisma stoltei TaxID=1481888 RepID=A0AAU9K723_9CILI|nr:unnamed protein product [Blepharisma stoltei]
MGMGSSFYYLFGDKNISIGIQQALASSKILVNGTGILLVGKSSYESATEGALAIVEKDRETIISNEKYLFEAISRMIYLLSNASNVGESLILLSKKCKNHYCVNDFSLLNIQNSQRKIVGSIVDGNAVLNNFSMIFPGNSVDVPKSQKKILYFSANDGTTNPGSPSMEIVTFYKRGFTLALQDMNNGIDILQNFQLKLNDFDCGASVYNEKFCYNCINKDKNRLGLAHIVSVTSSMAYGQIATMAKLNITIPLIGVISLDPGLSNSTKYPYFTRVILPSNYAFKQIPLLLKVMGWESIAIIYQNDTGSITSNYYLSQAAEEQNIHIVNKLKIIPFSLTRDSIRNYTNVFQEIIDTNVRFVVLLLNSAGLDYTAELFYDLGMRKGDIIFLNYMTIFIKFKAYNYGRFNLWHKLSLIGVAWVSCLCTINFLIEGSGIPWVALILGGWTSFILIGLIVQRKKYPSLLFRKEKDTSNLFKFAFTFGKSSKAHHSKIEPQKLDLFNKGSK